MTDFKATPEQWAQIERSQVFNGSFQACVLELRSRVEALEANTDRWRADHLRLANICASMAPDRNKFFADMLPDGGEDPKPTPNDRQTRSSLVERVADAIVTKATSAGIVDDRPARAAIREVAAWLSAHGHSAAADVLEVMEARR